MNDFKVGDKVRIKKFSINEYLNTFKLNINYSNYTEYLEYYEGCFNEVYIIFYKYENTNVYKISRLLKDWIEYKIVFDFELIKISCLKNKIRKLKKLLKK